jgi:hypothetical protein
MKNAESPSSPATFMGHVKNGVVIPDTQVSLTDGQPVRVEPLSPGTPDQIEAERADRLRRLQQLFAEWTEEDSQLSDEEADRLHTALEQNRGLGFRPPTLD